MNTLQTAATHQSSISRTTTAEWRVDFARIRGRVYLSIAVQIEEAIRSGVFSPGDRLPSQRALADDLGFHVNTINAAFKEAARRGLVRGCTRRGTVVLSRSPTQVNQPGH
jgi:DNA-binding transcriptional regulator YhcF (GntR family)